MPTLPLPRRAFALAGVLLAIVSLTPAAVAPVAAGTAAALVFEANEYRAGAGLAQLGVHDALQQIASERSDQMAASGAFVHDFEYVEQRLDQLGVCWQGFAEIIAYHSGSAPDMEKFGTQWYDSPSHRNIMLGSFTVAGGGVVTAADGRHYGTMVYVRGCSGGASAPPPVAASGGGFTDTGASAFKADIAWLVQSGITGGCGNGRFCPATVVTREQMASFLARALGLPASPADYFADDAGSLHQADINRVAHAGVSSGCTGTRFCPGAEVTRGQMAAFLARALRLPRTGGDYFADDGGSMFQADINALAAAGVASGCGAGRFCPDAPITREQMAAFLHRAFGR